jgi:hypothetical protein
MHIRYTDSTYTHTHTVDTVDAGDYMNPIYYYYQEEI